MSCLLPLLTLRALTSRVERDLISAFSRSHISTDFQVSSMMAELEDHKTEEGVLREELLRLKNENENNIQEIEQLTRQLDQRCL